MRLCGPKDVLDTDVYKRTLAIILLPKPDPTTTESAGSAQSLMIASGYSPYWRKYGEAPEPWHARLLEAQKAAEDGKDGAWWTAEKWMRDKANETTAKSENK